MGLKRVPLWLPYTSKIEVKGKKVKFLYKGGQEIASGKEIHSIMFYGSCCPLEQKFLDFCFNNRIPLLYYRRNLPTALWIQPSVTSNNQDLLTKQILFRENSRKRRHIARKILKAKFKNMSWLISEPATPLTPGMSIKELRIVESIHAKMYWQAFYQKLGKQYSRREKGHDNLTTHVLDAVSKFLIAICLRWIIYHQLSPYHGYLHEQSEYPALAYDIIEPFRGKFDQVVFETLKTFKGVKKEEMIVVGACINAIKESLYSKIYTEPTRQIVTNHELIHGIVLSLRSYLLGLSNRMLIPYATSPNGGRPVKTGFKLYGRSAGKTDFWEQARQLST